MTTRKTLIALGAAGLLAAAGGVYAASAQGWGPGGGPGAEQHCPGGGYGPGYGRMGGMGPGYGMGGRGPGYGMRGWSDEDGSGPQGGYGPGYGRGWGRGHGPGWGHGPGMMGRGPGWMRGGPGFAVDSAQLDKLKKELGVTAAQEPAWDKYAKSVQTMSDFMTAAREMREQGRKNRDAMFTAGKDLFGALSDEQKAKAQGALPGLGFGPGYGMGGRGGPGWGPGGGRGPGMMGHGPGQTGQ